MKKQEHSLRDLGGVFCPKCGFRVTSLERLIDHYDCFGFKRRDDFIVIKIGNEKDAMSGK